MHLNESYGLLKVVQLALNISPTNYYYVQSDKGRCLINITSIFKSESKIVYYNETMECLHPISWLRSQKREHYHAANPEQNQRVSIDESRCYNWRNEEEVKVTQSRLY